MRWEYICSNCSLCCHEKIVLSDMLVIDPDKACQYLSKDTGLCTVYKTRFKTCSRCMKVNPFRVMFSPALPPVCSYVRLFEHYHIRFVKKREMILSNIE